VHQVLFYFSRESLGMRLEEPQELVELRTMGTKITSGMNQNNQWNSLKGRLREPGAAITRKDSFPL